MNVIVLGPPGAGKGTQAERFARERGVPKISTGDILREAVQIDTPLGRLAKATMDAGGLVSDEVMIGIVRERLERPDALQGFVLDGFPRTVAQAQALDAIMTGRDPLIVVDIRVPEEVLIRRLHVRRICQKCGANAPPPDGADGDRGVCMKCGGPLVPRTDDGEESMRERLRVYHQTTEPLVEHYRNRPTFRRVDGNQPPDRVAAELNAAIDSVRATA